MNNPLEAYVACTRIVFSVEPLELSDNWEEFDEFQEKLQLLWESLRCNQCKQLLIDPCVPKKQHVSCQHQVCLDCIGKNRLMAPNCKMCRDFTLFEKSNQTKLVLTLFQELCGLIKESWIYDYIQRRAKPDTGQCKLLNLTDIIESGINYGQIPIIVDDSSSSNPSPTPSSSGNENSNSSMAKESSTVPYCKEICTSFPSISPLPPISPKPVQSIQPQVSAFNAIFSGKNQSFQAVSPPSVVSTQISTQNASSTVTQYAVIQEPPSSQAPAEQQIVPSTSKSISNQPPLPKAPSFVPQVTPLRVKPVQSVKSIMSPTIYSVMYTGSGNKITLKRKTQNDEQIEPARNIANNNEVSFHTLTFY